MARVQRFPDQSSAAAKPSLAQWLDDGLRFFAREDLDALRARATERLRRERDDALRRAREIDADIQVLAGTPKPNGSASTPVLLAAEGPPAGAKLTELIRFFVAKNPGTNASAVIEFAKRYLGAGLKDDNVHAVLYRLTKKGQLMTNGNRGSYTFSMREPVA